MQHRISALRQRHVQLEQELTLMLRQVHPDNLEIMRVKMKKLRVKDEIEALLRQLGARSWDAMDSQSNLLAST